MKRRILITIGILAAIAVAVLLAPDRWESLLAVAEWAEAEPHLAWPVFLIAFVAAVVMMFPGWLFMVVGGYLFGMLIGGLLSFIANLAGSVVAFFLAKTYARHWVEAKLATSPRFQDFDAAVERNGFGTILFARLALLPNNLLNYASGLTGMRLGDFVFGTALGSLPILIANVLIGASTMDLFTTMADGELEAARPPGKLLVAIIAGLALIVILARSLRRRLVRAAPDVATEEITPER